MRAGATLSMETDPVAADLKSPVLSVSDLRVAAGHVDIVKGVSFDIAPGEKLGIVGESGSGKSLTVRSVIDLLPSALQISAGSLSFKGQELSHLPPARMRDIRGRRISMIFQDPMSSLNPVIPIGRQLTEMMRRHLDLTSRDRFRRAVDLLERVKLPRPEQIMKSYPHMLSGGMRQRVAIAMALTCDPELIIADEPTTALDVTVQAEVIALLREAVDQDRTAVILISHSLDLIADFCDRILVMYAGRVVETGATRDVVTAPFHPYTRDLIRSSPDITAAKMARFPVIEGQPHSLADAPPGCPYHNRCEFSTSVCEDEVPVLEGAVHRAACWLTRGERQVT